MGLVRHGKQSLNPIDSSYFPKELQYGITFAVPKINLNKYAAFKREDL